MISEDKVYLVEALNEAKKMEPLINEVATAFNREGVIGEAARCTFVTNSAGEEIAVIRQLVKIEELK